MSAEISRRLCGALLFASFVGVSAVPAQAQSLFFFPFDRAPQAYDPAGPGAPDAAAPDENTAELPAALQRQTVSYAGGEAPGTIIIDTAHTFLYLTLGGGKAMRYGIGVGREGFTWSGVERITRKAEWPDWIPPAQMVARQPYLPRWVAGGPGNPLGARALYLGNTDYRIHGTNDPSTIGKHVSSGCIRLRNEDVTDLYSRVDVGTRVIVLPNAAERVSALAPDHSTVARHVPPQRRAALQDSDRVSGVY